VPESPNLPIPTLQTYNFLGESLREIIIYPSAKVAGLAAYTAGKTALKNKANAAENA